MTYILQRLSAALACQYAIEREPGSGGMATVYLACDIEHDRQVALKVLRPELSAILGGERFLAEIKTTANLQHPHNRLNREKQPCLAAGSRQVVVRGTCDASPHGAENDVDPRGNRFVEFGSDAGSGRLVVTPNAAAEP